MRIKWLPITTYRLCIYVYYGRSAINGSVGENAGGTQRSREVPIYAPKLSGLNATYLGRVSETFDALQTRLKFDDEVTQPEVPTAPKEQIHYERSADKA